MGSRYTELLIEKGLVYSSSEVEKGEIFRCAAPSIGISGYHGSGCVSTHPRRIRHPKLTFNIYLISKPTVHGRKPDLAHLRVPGCKFYVHAKQKRADKALPRAGECRLLDYGASPSMFLMYCKGDRRARHAYDIVLNGRPLGMTYGGSNDRRVDDLDRLNSTIFIVLCTRLGPKTQ